METVEKCKIQAGGSWAHCGGFYPNRGTDAHCEYYKENRDCMSSLMNEKRIVQLRRQEANRYIVPGATIFKYQKLVHGGIGKFVVKSPIFIVEGLRSVSEYDGPVEVFFIENPGGKARDFDVVVDKLFYNSAVYAVNPDNVFVTNTTGSILLPEELFEI